MRNILIGASLVALAACGQNEAPEAAPAPVEEAVEEVVEEVAEASLVGDLDAVLASDIRGENDAARDQYRNPKETLAFFGVEPGMTVVETLPGGGWYSKILLPYLGPEGSLIGANYAVDMWRLFGGRFSNEEAMARHEAWSGTWPTEAATWAGDKGAGVSAFNFGAVPEDVKGTVDVILFVRSLHHMNRFEEEGGWLTSGLQDTMAILKPGGIVGVVQHRGPEGNDDVWAEGDNGYMKQSQVIAAFEAAGFELVEASEINANAADVPTNDDIVWRLPPSLGTSGDDEEKAAAFKAIGESDRMTLKFRKPA